MPEKSLGVITTDKFDEPIPAVKLTNTRGMVRVVPTSSIKGMPVLIRSPSARVADLIVDMAKRNEYGPSCMTVGRVDCTLYLMDDPSILDGLGRGKITEIEANILDYSSLQLMVEDYVMNTDPEMVDPMRVRDVVEFLTREYLEVPAKCRYLWPSKWSRMAALVRCRITDEARNVLLNLAAELGKIIHPVIIPDYFMVRISKLPAAMQAGAATMLKSVILDSDVENDAWSWPTSTEVAGMLRMYYTVANSGAKSASLIGAAPPPKRRAPKTPKSIFLKRDRNLICIRARDVNDDLVINRKSGRVYVMKEVDGMHVLSGDLGESIHLVPDNVTKFLDIEDNKIRVVKCRSPEKAAEIISKIKPGSRCAILVPYMD